MAGGSNPRQVATPASPKAGQIGGVTRFNSTPASRPLPGTGPGSSQAQLTVIPRMPATPAPVATTPAAPTQPNIFQQSAGAYTGAINAANAAAAFQPQQVGTSFGYTPSNVAAQQVGTSFGYTPDAVSTNFGYTPDALTAERVGTTFGYDPQQVAAQAALGGIQQYFNPYEQQVIEGSMGDLERQRMRQMAQMGAQATAARAFGGSRQGVAQALTNEAFAQQGGQLASQLRAQGFQTALGASQQDVANQLQASLANQGAFARSQEFGQSTTLQAQQANQQAALQAAQANQAARAAAAQFAQSQRAQAEQANQAARAAAAQFGQSTGLQAQGMNQQTGLQAALANQAANAAATQFGQSTGLQAQLANQSAALSAAGLRAGAAGQLGGLAQQGFNMGQSITQQQAQQGAMQQAINQALIDAGRSQYGGFTGAPGQSLNATLAALGGANMGQQTQTTTQQPGLFNYLSLGLGALSDIRLKDDIKPAGEVGGVRFYTWNWNETGKRLADPKQPTFGVIADEVAVSHPQHVSRGADGYLRVNYAGLIGELRAA
jgi:hypothetical protein